MLKNRAKKRSKRRGNVPAHLARAGSFSSVTDSTMSLNCITVTLNMDTVSFLGISIVGQVRVREICRDCYGEIVDWESRFAKQE